eukprot:CAMPEP_0117663064 /NCGR_PEP_ID=MMETSP0804-20121206/8385_1 /TAXON_ID=1074897 /ORGANISM="Tetraselmis astigmatica, Strain CCMP880" /LENGTH=145 /DNA_ID=CAMNT_0005470001 /DNA_START=105 /DNA_END=542 /DNA_ORIENTATION=+
MSILAFFAGAVLFLLGGGWVRQEAELGPRHLPVSLPLLVEEAIEDATASDLTKVPYLVLASNSSIFLAKQLQQQHGRSPSKELIACTSTARSSPVSRSGSSRQGGTLFSGTSTPGHGRRPTTGTGASPTRVMLTTAHRTSSGMYS